MSFVTYLISGISLGSVYALIALTRLDRNFAFIFCFGGILVLIVITAFRKILKNTHKRVQETEAKFRSFLQESLCSLLMVKVFGIEKKVSQKAADLQEENYKAQMVRRNLTIFSTCSSSSRLAATGFSAKTAIRRLAHSAITVPVRPKMGAAITISGWTASSIF